jgi:hypothetical protein
MKTVLVEYTLSPTANVEDVERRIREFVDGIRALQVGVWYTSHRVPGEGRSYKHVGFMPNEEAQTKLVSAPFFGPFGQYLRTVTVEPPRVTWLEVVATTA